MDEIVLTIPWDHEGIIRERPNRFLAIVDIPEIGVVGEKVHVHDPGRLKELLFPGNRVRVRRMEGGHRKTKWERIAARFFNEDREGKGGGGDRYDGSEHSELSGDREEQWILVHSGFHRYIAEAVLSNPRLSPVKGIKELRSEVKVGRSRIDFLAGLESGERMYIEVKGCSLTMDGIALFPDAPTERGTRHLETLERLICEETNHEPTTEAAVLILVLGPEACCFSPNRPMDPKFARAFQKAREHGVRIHPVRFRLEDRELRFLGEIPVCEEAKNG